MPFSQVKSLMGAEVRLGTEKGFEGGTLRWVSWYREVWLTDSQDMPHDFYYGLKYYVGALSTPVQFSHTISVGLMPFRYLVPQAHMPTRQDTPQVYNVAGWHDDTLAWNEKTPYWVFMHRLTQVWLKTIPQYYDRCLETHYFQQKSADTKAIMKQYVPCYCPSTTEDGQWSLGAMAVDNGAGIFLKGTNYLAGVVSSRMDKDYYTRARTLVMNVSYAYGRIETLLDDAMRFDHYREFNEWTPENSFY